MENHSKFKNLYKKYVEFNKSNVGKAFNWGCTVLLFIGLFLTKTDYGRNLQTKIFRNDIEMTWFKSDDIKYTSDDIDLVTAMVFKKYPEFKRANEFEQLVVISVAGLSDEDFDRYMNFIVKQGVLPKSYVKNIKTGIKKIHKIVPEWKGTIEYEEILMMEGMFTAYAEDESLFDYQESIEQSFKEVEEELSKLVEKEFDDSIVKEKEKPVKTEEVVEEKIEYTQEELDTYLRRYVHNYDKHTPQEMDLITKVFFLSGDDKIGFYHYLIVLDIDGSDFVQDIKNAAVNDYIKPFKNTAGSYNLPDMIKEFNKYYEKHKVDLTEPYRKEISELTESLISLESDLDRKQQEIDILKRKEINQNIRSLMSEPAPVVETPVVKENTIEATVSYNDVALSMLSATYDISHLTDKQKLIVSKGFQLKNEDKDRFIRDLIARDLVEMDFVNELELLIRESDSFEHETISIGQALSEL